MRESAPIFATEPNGTTVHYLGVAFSPDGRELAAGTTGREVVRWDMSDPARPTPLPALTGFSSYVNELNYGKDGTRLAAGSSDNSVRVWDPRTGALIETLPDSGAVTTVDYSDDGRNLVTGGLNGVTRVWALPGPVWAGSSGHDLHQSLCRGTARVWWPASVPGVARCWRGTPRISIAPR